MVEAFFGFKKTPFGDSPDTKQLFASQAWNQVKARLASTSSHRSLSEAKEFVALMRYAERTGKRLSEIRPPDFRPEVDNAGRKWIRH